MLRNPFWVYDIKQIQWSCIHGSEDVGDHNDGNGPRSSSGPNVPCARSAYQFIYDQNQKIHYLFGGNPCERGNNSRLDDFWSFEV